jgi:hypothetical protein
MTTERNQLASVGRLHIWWLSDGLPEKEVLQSVRIYRDGFAKPILAEETLSFHSTIVKSCAGDEASYGTFHAGRKSLHQQVQITAHRDADHTAFRNSGSKIKH